MGTALKVEVSFEQILDLVKQLPKRDKLKLSRELEKDAIDNRLSKLLKVFKTKYVSLKTIDEEVEAVRKNLYESGKH